MIPVQGLCVELRRHMPRPSEVYIYRPPRRLRIRQGKCILSLSPGRSAPPHHRRRTTAHALGTRPEAGSGGFRNRRWRQAESFGNQYLALKQIRSRRGPRLLAQRCAETPMSGLIPPLAGKAHSLLAELRLIRLPPLVGYRRGFGGRCRMGISRPGRSEPVSRLEAAQDRFDPARRHGAFGEMGGK